MFDCIRDHYVLIPGVVDLPYPAGQDSMEKSAYACYNVYAEEVDSLRVFFGEAVYMVEENIRNLFLEYPEVIYGFTDIAYSAYAGTCKSALVFAVPHGEQLTLETYSEEKFEKGLQDAKKTVEKILTQLKTVLDEQEIKYHIPPLA